MDIIIAKLESIEKRLDNIENRLGNIENNVENINMKMNGIEVNTNMMGNHIHFVEDVYEKVKRPLNYITHKINNMIT